MGSLNGWDELIDGDDVQMDGWMDGWMDEQMNGWNVWKNEWMNGGWTNEWMVGKVEWKDDWLDGVYGYTVGMNGWVGQMDGQTDDWDG